MLDRIKSWAPWAAVPPEAEQDPGFREDIRRGSVLALRTVGLLEIVAPALMLAAGLGVIPMPVRSLDDAWPNLSFILLGAATLAFGATETGKRWARPLTAASVWVSAAIIVWASLLHGSEIEWADYHILGYMVLVLFGTAAAVPLKPAQTLALGLSLDAFYLASSAFVQGPPGFTFTPHLVTFVVTLLCAALNASVYRQRYLGYVNHQQALRTSERLREAESKLLISENAATVGRVAAALSHELNSPIGVLSSAVDTLAHIAQRMDTAPPEQRERLRKLLQEVGGSGRASAERLRGIVARIQRFTNLDRAEVQSANLNQLLGDVISLAASESAGKANIAAEFGDVPQFVCRPQQMSAVFSNLIGNAVSATEDGGGVLVRTAYDGDRIEITIQDSGRGISPEDLETLFDPAAFRVSSGRIQAGHWSLFSCRQIVREHGGEIQAESAPGQGSTMRIALPAGGGAIRV